MQGIALVRCDGVEHVVEDGDPCTVLCAKLVVPIGTTNRGYSGENEYKAIEWTNQPEEEIPRLPRPGKTVCLIPHPDGVGQTLIVGGCRVFKVWGGPVLVLFCLYIAQFDASSFLGKVFIVREI
jgi:hypothetical protein